MPHTPRRSIRLQKIRENTPEAPKAPLLGPRAMMLNKLKPKLLNATPPSIIVTESTPSTAQKRRGRKKRSVVPENHQAEPPSVVTKEKVDESEEKKTTELKSPAKVATEKKDETQQGSVATTSLEENSEIKTEDETIITSETTYENNTVIDLKVKPDEQEKKEAVTADPNTTPQLMDESVISVPDTPPPEKDTTTTIVKDVTFSPVVDTSIHDSRPHIDIVDTILNTTPIQRSKPIRTSTPLAQKILRRETPKLSAPTLSALAKMLTPKIQASNGKMTEQTLNETLNGQYKFGNPLEKSILKSSRRKRSLSVTDSESFMQKRVVFREPEIMDIDSIDQKMMQSFMEEQDSIRKEQKTSDNRRKRSLSVSDSPSVKKTPKMPNFKAIHEQQFKKMESILDHAQRKEARAKRLATPSKLLPSVPENMVKPKVSKIPTAAPRKPLAKVPSRDNIASSSNSIRPPLKRSASVDVHGKFTIKMPKLDSDQDQFKTNEIKKKNQVGSSAAFEMTAKAKVSIKESSLKPKVYINMTSTIAASSSSTVPMSTSQAMRKKVEDRRERNTSLYKAKPIQGHRKKTETLIKGVRLNRRFELQMQHRNGSADNSDN
jgi:hypothetical protein